jgi:hypothetical protein
MIRRIAKQCGNNIKVTATDIWKKGNIFYEWDDTYPLLLM